MRSGPAAAHIGAIVRRLRHVSDTDFVNLRTARGIDEWAGDATGWGSAMTVVVHRFRARPQHLVDWPCHPART